MKKKIYSAWLVVLALLLTALPAFAAAMQDPAQPITRQEFCNETYRLLQQTGRLPQLAGDAQYADATDQGVLALTELGLVEGIGQGYFAPDRGLTREEGAVILDRLYAFLLTETTPETGDAATGLAAAATGTAAGAEPVNTATAQTADTAAVSAGNDIFSDSQAISSWAKDSVYRLSQLGIIRGTTETAFSPQQPLTYEQGTALLLRLQDLCLPTAITSLSYQAALAEICATPRWIGTVGEQQAVSKIAQRFTEYGYQVELQSFPFAETNNLKGVQVSNHATNVIAVKQPADGKGNGDILIVSAHHDSMPSTVGANDNGSGTALLLELAKAVQQTATDTEIRFISFSGEEEGLQGSAYYVSQLPQEERERIVGDVQIDMVGHYQSKEIMLKTTDGQPTLVGNLINQQAAALLGAPLRTETEAASDHMSFVRGQIPAVLVEQDNLGVENHRFSDQPSIIVPDKVVPLAQVLKAMLEQVMSSDSGSFAAEARTVTQVAESVYTFTDETILFMGEDKSITDNRIGGSGTLVKTEQAPELDMTFEYYQYPSKWFDLPQTVPTVFQCRAYQVDGATQRSLEQVMIYTEGWDLSPTELESLLTQRYGEPIVYEDGAKVWGGENSKYLKQYQIGEWDGQPVLFVFSSHFGSGWTYQTYDLAQGLAAYENVDPLEYGLLEFVYRLKAPNDQHLDYLEVWSDGISYILGAALPTDSEDNSSYTIRIDIHDVFDDQGNYRDLDKTLATFVHEYGHVLTLNNEQVDLSKLTQQKSYYTPEAYRDGSYIKAFYDRFWNVEAGELSYYQHPDRYVNEYASQNVTEDIAESFMVFVLDGKQPGQSLAAQKVNFFYQYPELVAVRDSIRRNFDYPVEP